MTGSLSVIPSYAFSPHGLALRLFLAVSQRLLFSRIGMIRPLRSSMSRNQSSQVYW
jgi:hypothetical protein